MQIKVSARHGHLSDEHQQDIRQKVEKLLTYFDRITMIDVTVDLADKIHKKVEILVDAEHKHDFVATEESESLMASIDTVVHKLEQQLRKYKEKIQNRSRVPGNRTSSLPAESNPETD